MIEFTFANGHYGSDDTKSLRDWNDLFELSFEQFNRWLERYFEAWRSNDPADVEALFAKDAVYHYGPFEPPTIGRRSIVERWVYTPSQQQDIQTTYEAIAVNGNTGVAHWNATFRYGTDQGKVEADGILLIKFDQQLLCIEHQEWFSLKETG